MVSRALVACFAFGCLSGAVAIVDDETLDRIDQELNAGDYRTHKVGDSVFLEKADDQMRSAGKPSAAACVILSQSRSGLPVIGTLGG